jgi:hypothetical protein
MLEDDFGRRSWAALGADSAGVFAALSVLACLACGSEGSPGETAGSGAGDEPVARSQAAIGSSEQETTINSLQQLRQMTVTGNYKLIANIDASPTANTPFVPIGSVSNPFRGTFNGNDCVISNLRISAPNDWHVGMFSAVDGALLTKVALTGVNVRGAGYTGAIAGIAWNSELSLSYVTGTVSGSPTNFGMGIGMVFGRAGIQVRVSRSYATGTVTGKTSTIGGFIGEIEADGTPDPVSGWEPRVTVDEVYTNVNVNPTLGANETWNVLAGGLVGFVRGAVIHDINVVGPVTGRGYAGGVVGYFDNNESWSSPSIIGDTISRGIVTVSGISGRAGPIGFAEGGFMGCDDESFWDTTTDTGSPPPMDDPQCQVGHSSTTLKNPHPAPNKLINPYIHGMLVTQQLINEENRPQCQLNSGTDGDWGFGTCGTTQIWALNTNGQYNTLVRIPNASQQPK